MPLDEMLFPIRNLSPQEQAAALQRMGLLQHRALCTNKNLEEHVQNCPVCWRESSVVVTRQHKPTAVAEIERQDIKDTMKVVTFCDIGLKLATKRIAAKALYDEWKDLLSHYAIRWSPIEEP